MTRHRLLPNGPKRRSLHRFLRDAPADMSRSDASVMSILGVAAPASLSAPPPPRPPARLLGWALALLVVSGYLAAPVVALLVLAFSEIGAGLLFSLVTLLFALPALLLAVANITVLLRARRLPGRAVTLVAVGALACNIVVLAVFVWAGGVDFLLR